MNRRLALVALTVAIALGCCHRTRPSTHFHVHLVSR
jgi:hypothetical protein